MGKKTSSRKNKKYVDTQPVFRLEPVISENKCVVKHVGYMNKDDRLIDQQLTINTPKNVREIYGENVHYVGCVNDYEIFVRVYHCNLLGQYLLKSDKLPIYNMSIRYNKTILKGELANIYINLNMTEKMREEMTSNASYVNATLSGKITMNFDGDELIHDVKNKYLEKKIDEYTESAVLDFMEKNKDVEIDFETVGDSVRKKMDELEKYLNDIFVEREIPEFYSHNTMLKKYFAPLFTSEYIVDFLKIALETRDNVRRKECDIDESLFTLPTRVLKLSDVYEDESVVDRFLGIEED